LFFLKGDVIALRTAHQDMAFYRYFGVSSTWVNAMFDKSLGYFGAFLDPVSVMALETSQGCVFAGSLKDVYHEICTRRLRDENRVNLISANIQYCLARESSENGYEAMRLFAGSIVLPAYNSTALEKLDRLRKTFGTTDERRVWAIISQLHLKCVSSIYLNPNTSTAARPGKLSFGDSPETGFVIDLSAYASWDDFWEQLRIARETTGYFAFRVNAADEPGSGWDPNSSWVQQRPAR
jgi:hypothetical protein